MRLRVIFAAVAGACLAVVPTAFAAASHHSAKLSDRLSLAARLLGKQALPSNDGWGAAGSGTTGGSAAPPDQIFVVRTRAELIEALGGDNATNRTNATPKIIYIKGTINGFEGPDGKLLTCEDLADPKYSLAEYLATYDPAVWGRVNPSGPLEEARVRSVANQTRQTQINVGPNTTIIGLRGATLKNLTLMIDSANNVIVRNITFSDARDCFPAWSPTDGAEGNWNSQFDMISVRRSENVWIDHNTFTDGDNPDSAAPIYFGRPYLVHDGALDITHTASYVTVSHNVFTNHDKVMLIGSTNNPSSGDRGRLNVTVRHNVFDDNIQRLPRVRFGQVDVYNNVYRISSPDPFDYALGVGVESAIYAENNYFALGKDVPLDSIIRDWGGTVITERGSYASVGKTLPRPVNLLGEYNASHDPDLGPDAGWTPTLRSGPPLPTLLVPLVVPLLAGANLPA